MLTCSDRELRALEKKRLNLREESAGSKALLLCYMQ